MRVRRASGEDASAIAGVLAAVAEEGWIATEPPVDVDARARRIRDQIEGEDRGASWVLEEGDRMVGSLGMYESVPGVFGLGMAVLPGSRGQGGGRALLDAAIDHARELEAHKIDLEVWPDNARAIALYASAGFAVEGLRRHHYRRRDGSLRSALIMALLLGE